ncbi:TetR family transcriptional regulator, partial [Escherichia coli]|uniref:TetR family transcriptional regulator n=1 Tax=Escherichia coli TaxID=562 RepID=UPI00207B8346
MARKTKQEAQETRQHILDVALRLFSQQGVSSTSLGEIAKAAGVTRGAIYWHFKDKSDLFSEIWELSESNIGGFAPIFPDTCYHLTHYWLAAV